METKEKLYRELTRLTVESEEINRSIVKLTKPAGELSKGEGMTEIVPDRELGARLKELEKRRDEVERKRKEVLIRYQGS